MKCSYCHDGDMIECNVEKEYTDVLTERGLDLIVSKCNKCGETLTKVRPRDNSGKTGCDCKSIKEASIIGLMSAFIRRPESNDG